MTKKLFFLVCIFIVAAQGQAHAYLDPGTGAIILQATIAFIAVAVSTILVY